MMMALAYQNLGRILALLFLLVCSAFFSGSETAFFSLTRRQIRQLSDSASRLEKLAARLLRRPGHLLNCLLLGNMAVNVFYFSIGSVLVLHARQSQSLGIATAAAFLVFIVLVLFGEILPKSLAYSNPRSLAAMTAIPLFLVVQVLGPIAWIFRVVLLRPILRILLGSVRLPRTITLAEFRSLVNLTRQRGLISEDENKLLGEVIDLGTLKVRHVMQPRVDMIACGVNEPPVTVRRRMQEHHRTKIPVYVRTLDNIVGMVHLRQLFLQPEASLEQLMQPVHFVPEQKTVVSLLEFFRKSGTDMAVVVDEYGGIAGAVQVEDIAEEVFGHIEPTSAPEPIERIGPFQYRLAGDLPIHDWADAFGIDLQETRQATIGGLVTSLLDRIPRKGDVARIGNAKFTVERVRRRRIETVILSFEPISSDG